MGKKKRKKKRSPPAEVAPPRPLQPGETLQQRGLSHWLQNSAPGTGAPLADDLLRCASGALVRIDLSNVPGPGVWCLGGFLSLSLCACSLSAKSSVYRSLSLAQSPHQLYPPPPILTGSVHLSVHGYRPSVVPTSWRGPPPSPFAFTGCGCAHGSPCLAGS